MDVTLVNALLFIGIIGTFYGLMLFLGDERFIGLIRTLDTDATVPTESIPDILDGFRVAFGSSLIAYIAYLIGRFLVDLADEAFDETVAHMTARIDRRLAVALSIGPTVGKVDIAPAVKRLLQEQSAEVKLLVVTVTGMMTRTEGIASALQQAAGELSQSVAAAGDLTQGLQKTFSTLKSDWEQTTATWRSATDTFAASAGNASGSIETSARQMVALQENLGTSASRVLDQLCTLTEQTTSLLEQQEASLRQSFTQAAETFAGSLTKATGDLHAGVDRYGGVVLSLRRSLDDTAAIQSNLEQAMVAFQKIFQQSLLENDDTYRQLVSVFGERSSEVAGAIDRMQQTLLTLSTSLRALDHALYGSEDAASLTTALRELNARIAVGLPAAAPSLATSR